MPDPILLLTDERMLDHAPGADHPERPDRLRVALAALDESGLTIDRLPVREGVREDFERVHSTSHVDRILALTGQSARLDADTVVSPGSVLAARLACGATLGLVESILDPALPSRGLALVRPPGHHAEATKAMGFCLFGNIAIAAVHAIDRLGLKRVMIVDWDVHHGNGTQHLLEERGDVLVLNLHQDGIYPHMGHVNEIGRGLGEGATINIPLPGGSRGGEYLAAFEEVVIPAADRFRPDLILVSAGFDGHARDPLAGQDLETEDFAAMCAQICQIAERHCAGRVGLVLEGGYDLEALAESVLRCAEVLAGGSAKLVDADAGAAQRVLDRVRRVHGLD